MIWVFIIYCDIRGYILCGWLVEIGVVYRNRLGIN